MFNPKYRLSRKLLQNITKIERFYGQIESLKIPSKLELNLTRSNLIVSAYASNKIEGNPITLPEATNLILDDRIPVNRDEKEADCFIISLYISTLLRTATAGSAGF